MHRDYVCGTAFGIKRKSGKLTGIPSYVVFVEKKGTEVNLDKSQFIPKTVTRNRKRLSTDVVEMGPLQFHSTFQLSDPHFIRDNLTPGGTLTCFVKIIDEFFALSCAHVIWGQDKDPMSLDPIEIYDKKTDLWKSLGNSITGLRDKGLGYAPDFGYIDAGLASITIERLQKSLHNRAKLQQVLSPPEGYAEISEIQNLAVHAHSIVSGKLIEAVITGVYFFHSSGFRFDLTIETHDRSPITFPGDSGLLWLDEQERAVAMHVMGERAETNQGSRISFSTFIFRILKRFNALPLC